MQKEKEQTGQSTVREREICDHVRMHFVCWFTYPPPFLHRAFFAAKRSPPGERLLAHSGAPRLASAIVSVKLSGLSRLPVVV